MAQSLNYRFIGAYLLVFGNVFLNSEAVLKTSFMEDLCMRGKTSFIDLKHQTTGILMSVPQFNRFGEFDCEVQLLPSKGDSVVLSIHRYDVDSQDKLTIEDSDRYMVALVGWGNFKDEKKAFISEGKMAIRYQRNSSSALHPRSGFQFTFTKVKNSPCYDNEFQCQNGKCVLKDLVCDGHNHCGDGSDQKKCAPKDSKNNNEQEMTPKTNNTAAIWIITISVGGMVLLIVLIVFTVVLIRRSKANKSIASNENPASSSDGNVPLQSVSSSVPHQPPVGGMQQPSTVPPATIPSDAPLAAPATALPNTVYPTIVPTATSVPPASFYDRLRRSVRRQNPQEEVHHAQQERAEPYQVPSMYPSLDQVPSAPEMYGVDNPDFKIEE